MCVHVCVHVCVCNVYAHVCVCMCMQVWFDVHEDRGQKSFRPTVGHFDQLLVILIKIKCTVGHFLLSY